MITYKNLQIDNCFTEGFGVSITEPFSLKINAGTIKYINTDESIDVYTYNEFEFDVEVSTNYTTLFDVYLLENEHVHVDRTELYEGMIPIYEGTTPIKHTLLSFTVPANIKTLNDIDISVNTLGGVINEDQSE